MSAVEILVYIKAAVLRLVRSGNRGKSVLREAARKAAIDLLGPCEDWPDYLNDLVEKLCEIAVNECLRDIPRPSLHEALRGHSGKPSDEAEQAPEHSTPKHKGP
ncbi:MAG TPA: hypothetical protein VFP92_07080 [Rhodanobacteraceae bacterium]|nr:hypothetical protein [Rhodanobacteraceae bacterium]